MANVWRRCPSSRLTSADLYQKISGGVSQLVAGGFFEAGGAEHYVYNGVVAMGIAQSSVRQFSRVYSGAIALRLAPSGSAMVDRTYSGAVAMGLVPGCSRVLDRVYSGQGDLSMAPSYAASLARAFNGLVGMVLSPRGDAVSNRVYEGVTAFRMVLSAIVEFGGGDAKKARARYVGDMWMRRKK